MDTILGPRILQGLRRKAATRIQRWWNHQCHCCSRCDYKYAKTSLIKCQTCYRERCIELYREFYPDDEIYPSKEITSTSVGSGGGVY